MKIDILTASRAVAGEAIGSNHIQFTGVTTDSRNCPKGYLFVALNGDRFDGHNFLAQAKGSGAAAVMIDKSRSELAADLVNSGIGVVAVDDTLKGLQDLAQYWRKQNSWKVIAVTGTNGKTTTKDFVGQLLGQKFSVAVSKGSFNNHIGVPLTLLSATENDQICVAEMGMNHAGEIRQLVGIADPDVVGVTNVGIGHLEGLGTVAQVAQAKEEIYRYSRADSLKIFNLDNEWTAKMYGQWHDKGHTVSISTQDEKCDIYLQAQSVGMGEILVAGHIHGSAGEARLKVFGSFNGINCAFAAAFAHSVGMGEQEIWNSLPQCQGSWGRNQMVPLKSGALALFDGYNANPSSFSALLSSLSGISPAGKTYFVLGDMLELGDESEQSHWHLGQSIAHLQPQQVVYIGQFSAPFAAGFGSVKNAKKPIISDSYQVDLAAKLGSVLKPGDVVIVKGSRGMKLERVIADLDPVDFDLKY